MVWNVEKTTKMGGTVRQAGVCIHKIEFFTTFSDELWGQYINSIWVWYIPNNVSMILPFWPWENLRSSILGFMDHSAEIWRTPWVWLQWTELRLQTLHWKAKEFSRGFKNGEYIPFWAGAAVDQDGRLGEGRASPQPGKTEHLENLDDQQDKLLTDHVQPRSLPPGQGEQPLVPQHPDLDPHGGRGAASRLHGRSFPTPWSCTHTVSLLKSFQTGDQNKKLCE